jgi:UDP-N-acetylglucosamine acyltransferase
VATEIHHTATVHPDAQIGRNVEIGPGCVVESDVYIGDYSKLDPYSQVKRFTRLGGECHGSEIPGRGKLARGRGQDHGA